MSWKCYTYMVECGNGSLYTGSTDNLIRRMEEHRKGIGARYVRMCGFKSIVLAEEHPDRSAAMRREIFLKKLPVKEKKRIASEGTEATKMLLDRWGLMREFTSTDFLGKG